MPVNGVNDNVENSLINDFFTESEVLEGIKTLKNNKSPGVDLIVNEFIKVVPHVLCPVLTKLFNVILATGCIPEAWVIGIIVPIYKKKGSVENPENYRGITLLSCVGKMFTSLVSKRVSKYVENFELLGNEQAGFRKNFSTSDHIFLLHVLIELYTKMKKQKLFCAFIDYRKAFDSVSRVHLWSKLLSHNINGKILNVVKNMYSKAKSMVKFNNVSGDIFSCDIGVRQGESLSPILFALYLNE